MVISNVYLFGSLSLKYVLPMQSSDVYALNVHVCPSPFGTWHVGIWASVRTGGTSCEMPGWMKHKQESRFTGEISIISDMQMTLPLWQKVKKS